MMNNFSLDGPSIFEYKLPNFSKDSWNCPNCYGIGYMPDGRMSIGPDKCEYKPCSTCWVCKGSGRVYVTAAPRFDKDEDEKSHDSNNKP